MTMFEKYCQLKIDGRWIGLEQIIGWSNLSAVLVHRYLCCECGYSEEWIDKEDVQKLKKKYS